MHLNACQLARSANTDPNSIAIIFGSLQLASAHIQPQQSTEKTFPARHFVRSSALPTLGDSQCPIQKRFPPNRLLHKLLRVVRGAAPEPEWRPSGPTPWSSGWFA